MDWISVKDSLPPENETVWLISQRQQTAVLGCLVYIINEGYFYAGSNGFIYVEDGKIVTECEIDDIEVTHWLPLPKLPPKEGYVPE